MDDEEEPKARAFSLFKDLNMVAISTGTAVYLIDFEHELKFSSRIPQPNVVFIAYVDIYIVLMAASDDDDQEAHLSCRMLYGEEEGSIAIKRFMGQEVKVKVAVNSIIFSCGSQIGRVSVPEMELQY